jgi:hypothetical protein
VTWRTWKSPGNETCLKRWGGESRGTPMWSLVFSLRKLIRRYIVEKNISIPSAIMRRWRIEGLYNILFRWIRSHK